MSARLVPLCQVFRAYVEPLCGYPVAYPDPGYVQIDSPVGIVNPVSSPLTYRGGSEQEWLDQIRLDVMCSLVKATPLVLLALHALPEVFADLFTASEPDKYTLGGIVNRCAMTGYEFGTVDRQGAEFAIGRFSFDVKRHRFAGES